MKRYLLVFLVFAALLTSCKKVLDVKPEDRQSITNAFDTDKELMAFLTTIEGEVQRLIINDAHQYMGAPASKCDNTSFVNLRNLVPATVKGSLYSNWKEHYDVVYLSNLILENIYQAEGKIGDDRINFYKGQAHFYKAWMYFELGKIWGNAIITTGTNNFDAYTNSKDYEVINEAISNMEKAYTLLGNYGELKDDLGNVLLSKQYGSKGSAAAMLSHLYAWKGSMAELYNWPGITANDAYTASVSWATKLISGEAAGPYALAPNIKTLIEQNFGTWNPAASALAKENILDVQAYYPADNTGTGFANPLIRQYTTWPVVTNAAVTTITTTTVAFKFTPADVNAMYKGTDQRKNEYFYKFDSMAASVNKTYAYPQKVRKAIFRAGPVAGQVVLSGLDCNDVYFRLADIYLLRAECLAKLGRDGEAIADLNTIRSRASAAIYPAAGEADLKMAIFKEREKELLMEKNRYYDVLRNGKTYIKTQLSPAFASLTDVDINDGALYLFIGSGAFVNNTLLRQNIYWNRVE